MTRTFCAAAEKRQRLSTASTPSARATFLCCAVLSAGIAVSTAALADETAAVTIVRSLAAQDATILRVGERLAIAATPFCSELGWSAGMLVQSLGQYRADLRPAATAELGLTVRPTITQVEEGGAAATAGLRAGDVILTIDGMQFADGEGGKKGFDGIRAAHDAIDVALADGRAELRILRGGETKAVSLIPRRACQVRFDLRAGKSKKEASANGTYVLVSSGLAAFARGDGELATVLAHELAHHILRHPQLLRAKSGRPSVRDTEIQADRLSAHLMDAAGYSIKDAVGFYTRWGPQTDLGVFSDRTHPGWKKRVAAIEAEWAAIEAMKASGQPVRAPADLRPSY